MSAPLRCLLVDDEPLAHSVLQAHLARLPGLATWVGSCLSAPEALVQLRAAPVDVLFLDINMPGFTGLELLRTLAQPPAIVLCTAHTEHALEAYELGVADYLLKPVRFERFVKTINRLHALRPGATAPTATPVPEVAAAISLKTDEGTERIRLAELLFVEGYGNFVKCHLASGRVLLTAETIKQLETQLPPPHFMRVHKSYLVNMQQVERLSGNRLLIGKHELPVGATYRPDVVQYLQ